MALVSLAAAPTAEAVDSRPPASDGDYPTAPQILSPEPGTWNRLWEGTCNAVTVSASSDSSGIDSYWAGVDGDPIAEDVWIGTSVRDETEICLPTVGWTEGAHTVTVRAKDKAGNFSDPVSVSALFDTVPPAYPGAVTVRSTPGSRVIDVSWVASSDELSPTVDYLVGVSYADPIVTRSNHVTVSLPDEAGKGRPLFAQTVGVSSRDEHGFTSSSSSSIFNIDITPPTPPRLLQPAAGTWIACAATTFSGLSAGDNEASTGNEAVWADGTMPVGSFPGGWRGMLRVGPPIPISTTSTWNLQGTPSTGHPLGYCTLTEGLHTLTVVSQAALWEKVTGQPVTIGIDVTPPVSGTLAEITGTPWAGPVTLTWSRATDAYSGVRTQQVLLDGKAAATVGATVTSARVVVPPGTHSLRLRTLDGVGLSNDGPIRQATTRALTAPTAPRVTAPSASSTTSRTALVRWTASAPTWGATITRYEVVVDGRTRVAVSGGTLAVKVAVAKGTHRVQVRARDSAGHSTLGPAIAFRTK